LPLVHTLAKVLWTRDNWLENRPVINVVRLGLAGVPCYPSPRHFTAFFLLVQGPLPGGDNNTVL
jgi:hypothetical protein